MSCTLRYLSQVRADVQTVEKYTSNALAIQDAPRMRKLRPEVLASTRREADMPAWHDTSLTLIGPSVVDLVQHFCERWNFVKKFK